MNLNKISSFIKIKRKEVGLTQEELAQKLFVTEKAISRWETGRGTPDISLLLPLAKELKVDVWEILNGVEKKKDRDDVKQLIEYNEITKANKYNFRFKLVVLFYTVSVLTFLVYLRFEYDPNIQVNYFIRLFIVAVSSTLVILGNRVYGNYYVEKVEDKKKIRKFSLGIVFVYYVILLFNMVIFARYNIFDSYNLIPFKTITQMFQSGNIYSIVINVFGNLLVFMPMEYFLIELFNIKKPIHNFIVSLGITLTIELFQFIFKVGVLDIDDLLLCISGMMIFYFGYRKVVKL